jgi:peptide/nickel transport system ATP-binding protein
VGETPDAAHIPTGCRFHPRCPLAFDRCKVEEPPLFDVGNGQSAACWLVEGGRSLPVMPARVAPGTPQVGAAAAGVAADAPTAGGAV